MSDMEQIALVARMIYDSVCRDLGGDPTTPAEVTMVAENEGLIMERVTGHPGFTAELVRIKDGKYKVRYNADAAEDLRMLYMLHELAEFKARPDVGGLEIEPIRGNLQPFQACHLAAVECERLLIDALRRRGVDTTSMEAVNSRVFRSHPHLLHTATWQRATAAFTEF